MRQAASQPAFTHARDHVQSVLRAVLDASDPGRCVRAAMKQEWREFPGWKGKAPFTSCALLGAGKAAMAMAEAVLTAGGPDDPKRIRPALGLIVAPPGSRPTAPLIGANVRVMEADHPLPTQRNLIAAQALLDAARTAAMRGLPIIVVLSGGASAHLTLPERGITLADIRAATDALLKAGANIRELNTVRKHCEKLKGGKLARVCAPSPVFAFILSDVLGDPLDVIASGPTALDTTSAAEALGVLEQRNVLGAAPAIADHLKAIAERDRAPRPRGVNTDDAVFARVSNTVVGSNALAVAGAAEALTALGFRVVEARMGVEGEARVAGALLGRAIRQARAERGGPQPLAIVWGGETTVTVASPGHGFGGRNQEIACGAALAIEGEMNIAVAAFSTDGADGFAPPGTAPVAGAFVTGRSAEDARAAGVDLNDALAHSSTHKALARINAHLTTGLTGTNVNDIAVALAY